MNNLKELIRLIKDDEQIKRFQELEKIIDHNKSISDDYDHLLHLQKIMVKKEYEKSSGLQKAKEEYDLQFEALMKYTIIEEYLDLLEVINNDISMIKTIIESEIALDFD